MLRAGSAEIPRPDNDILLAAEQALFAEETATMEKMRELHEQRSPDGGYEFEGRWYEDIELQLQDGNEHLIFVRRSLNWVRHARAALLQEETSHGQ